MEFTRVFDPVAVSTGQPYYIEREADGSYVKYDDVPIYLASSGSLNLRAHLPSVYIQKIVVDPTKIVAFSGTRARKGKGKGKGKGKKGKSGFSPAAIPHKGGKGSSGVIPAVPGDPGGKGSSGVIPAGPGTASSSGAVNPNLELAEALGEYASWSSEFLLTVYHHSFIKRRIAGYAGEGRNFTTPHHDWKPSGLSVRHAVLRTHQDRSYALNLVAWLYTTSSMRIRFSR